MRVNLSTLLITLAATTLFWGSAVSAAELQLTNGWTEYSTSTGAPEAFLDDRIVYLKGAISSGTTGVAFTLPAGMRPPTTAYVAVDLCGANVGRLRIEPNGDVSVNADVDFADAQCFTSLEGASFAVDNGGFTTLALSNGWVGGSFGTSVPAARTIDGIVHLKGAMGSGTASAAFTLPAEFRPAERVYVTVGLCNAAKGRLFIQPNGLAQVLPLDADSQCFTSLDGVSYDPTAKGQTSLTLQNGWIGESFSTSAPAASLVDGVVHLKGALASGASTTLFTLPVEMRPETLTYVPVDLFFGAKGRLVIGTNGSVSVDPLGDFSEAQNFTSLDGAKFVARPDRFESLALQNGWIGAPFSTSAPAVAMIDGVVHFKGAIASGSAPTAFTLPIEMRPSTNVYVSVDMCNATSGRLNIFPSGVVSVQAEEDFADAQCFTSLDGAYFVHSSTPSSFFFLSNGWTGQPFSTGFPGVSLIRGISYLRGAMAGGTAANAFTLPASMRPFDDVYVPTNLFAAAKGRMIFRDTGLSSVFPLSSDSQDFTSLDGLSFDTASVGDTTLTLQNGWNGGVFSTGSPGASKIKGVVHLKGAMGNGASGVAFTLSPDLRPENRAYVPVDLCSGAKGRLVIETNGSTSVQAESSFSDAQCFTSLDGATYVVPEPASLPALITGLMLLGGLAVRRGQVG